MPALLYFCSSSVSFLTENRQVFRRRFLHAAHITIKSQAITGVDRPVEGVVRGWNGVSGFEGNSVRISMWRW